MHQPVDDGAGAMAPQGLAKSLFGLPQNLRLAQNQRIQAGGHPKQVSGGLKTAAAIEVRLDFFFLKARGFSQSFDYGPARFIEIIADGQYFQAIAGRQDQ
jgi:hypothetical protein